jgi:deoxyhypusine synthase
MNSEENKEILEKLAKNVYVTSVTSIDDALPVRGYDFNKGLDYEQVFKTYLSTGFQATSVGQAIETINSAIKWRLSDDPINEDD